MWRLIPSPLIRRNRDTAEDLATMIIRQQAGQVSETEMERILEELEAMSSEDADRAYKVQLTKSE